jgi:hypothetical protein
VKGFHKVGFFIRQVKNRISIRGSGTWLAVYSIYVNESWGIGGNVKRILLFFFFFFLFSFTFFTQIKMLVFILNDNILCSGTSLGTYFHLTWV